MAFLLPLIWTEWMSKEGYLVADDEFSEAKWIEEVPAYAIDQFTRVGGAVAREFVATSLPLRELMDELSIPKASRAKAFGDLLFLVEGTALIRRAEWSVGQKLRMPVRMLSTVHHWMDQLAKGIAIVRSQGDLVAVLRSQHLPHLIALAVAKTPLD